MIHTLTLISAGLLGLAACASTDAAPPAAEPAPAAERHRGLCNFDEAASAPAGCRWDGPWAGQLSGEAITADAAGAAIPADGLPLEEALAACAALGSRCEGVATFWYSGNPWVL